MGLESPFIEELFYHHSRCGLAGARGSRQQHNRLFIAVFGYIVSYLAELVEVVLIDGPDVFLGVFLYPLIYSCDLDVHAYLPYSQSLRRFIIFVSFSDRDLIIH